MIKSIIETLQLEFPKQLHFVNNYESCDAEDANILELKTTNSSGSYCICEAGYIEVSTYCSSCHYSWLNKYVHKFLLC